jgi:glycosyltransferase involved in cell wall biosynthesis
LRTIRALEPDIVHLVSTKPVIYGGLVARMIGSPAVVSAITGLGHNFSGVGFAAKMRERLLLLAYRLSLRQRRGCVVFQTAEHLDWFCRLGIARRENAILVRGSGVDTSLFAPSREPDGAVTIMFASRMLREKGVFEFVEAARRIRSAGRPARFLLVGAPDGKNPGAIELSQLETWHREGAVEWLGHRNDMHLVLRDVHVVCLPTYYGEGVPKVLIEAAASGRPIVTTDIPGCRDIARHGLNALLAPPRDVDALASALTQLIENRDLRISLGSAGRLLAEREFSEAAVHRQMLALYAELGQPGAHREGADL